MAIVINFAGASLRKPGAYSRTRVAQGGAAQAQLGVVALIGEANEGSPFASESGLSAVTFSPEQFSAMQDKFGSGPLVDAARLALAPSNDTQIAGGAQQIVLLKTNQSVKASLALASSYGTITAKKAGTPGNALSVDIANSSGQRVITIADAISGDSEISAPLGGTTAFTIQATGGTISAATMTITATTLTTAITGSGASNLSLELKQFATLKQLVDYIALQPGYTCTLGSSLQGSQPVSVLDRVSAANIFTAPYALKRDAYDIAQFFAASALVTFTQTSFIGIPSVLSKTFLSGGALGSTSNANIQACFDALLKMRVNFVVPLFSRDASAGDIAGGLTDAASAYTIASVHSMTRTHCAQASTVKGRKERQAWVGHKGAFSASKTAAADLGSARVALCIQDVDMTNSAGDLVTAQPHMLAVASAGMKAAAVVGLPNTFKLVNINGFTHADFDPETQADDAIEAGITFVESAPGGGIRFVLDNSTYGQVKDAWIYARPSVLYAADTAAFAIRLNTETFVGQRNSDVSPETIKNLLISVLDGLRSSGIIVPDANTGGKGFKDLTVSFEGSIIRTSVTLALVEGFEFVLNDIQVARAVA
jgi:hypothetical protein